MPWSSDKLNTKIEQSRKKISSFLGTRPEAPVFLCTQAELIARVKDELLSGGTPEDKITFLEKHIFPLLLGKYFKKTAEVWLVEGKGDSDSILVHELLHSIQTCSPKRENICDYLTYRITNDQTIMDEKLLSEWKEIERAHGLKGIKARFLSPGDCEDFF
nr:hypothetical protein [Candidatus Sigynarchaeum springense]